MNETVPAPVRPTVPWGERLGAGLLAVGWTIWHFVWPYTFASWRATVAWGLERGQNVVSSLLHFPGFTALLNSISFLTGVRGSLALATHLGALILIVGGIAMACGGYRRGRAVYWWLVLVHGAANGLQDMINSRWNAVFDAQSPGGSGLLPWYRDWFDLLGYRSLPTYLIESWPYLLEILLAALVLGYGWWQRRAKAEEALAAGNAKGAGSRA